MGAPVFALAEIPFDPAGLAPQACAGWEQWPLVLLNDAVHETARVAVVSMGNPHAVLQVADVATAPVARWGPLIQAQQAFPRGVNVGFMQIVNRSQIRLRVFERGVGETLACGSGACAAVVAGIRLGLLEPTVAVQTRGGDLSIFWGGAGASVMMTGPATPVFHGEIDLPDTL